MIDGHGVGKKSFLVGVAVDGLLREGRVLHVSSSHPVAHVRAYYDTVFDDVSELHVPLDPGTLLLVRS